MSVPYKRMMRFLGIVIVIVGLLTLIGCYPYHNPEYVVSPRQSLVVPQSPCIIPDDGSMAWGAGTPGATRSHHTRAVERSGRLDAYGRMVVDCTAHESASSSRGTPSPPVRSLSPSTPYYGDYGYGYGGYAPSYRYRRPYYSPY